MTYMNVEIEYKNEMNEFDYVDVVLKGSFDYDFDDYGRKFTICEDISWDKSDYTQVTNNVIEKYINDNFDQLSQDLCTLFNS